MCSRLFSQSSSHREQSIGLLGGSCILLPRQKFRQPELSFLLVYCASDDRMSNYAPSGLGPGVTGSVADLDALKTAIACWALEVEGPACSTFKSMPSERLTVSVSKALKQSSFRWRVKRLCGPDLKLCAWFCQATC